MLTCKEATQMISEAQDRRLGLWDRFGVWRHLLICAWCRRYAKQVQLLTRSMRGNREKVSDAPQTRLDDAARARIKDKLNSL